MSEGLVSCPYCGEVFSENCEHCDIGIGYIQCSPNYCPSCAAHEIGGLRYEDLDEDERKTGWRKGRTLIIGTPIGRVGLRENIVGMYKTINEVASSVNDEPTTLSEQNKKTFLGGLSDLASSMLGNHRDSKEIPEVLGCLGLVRDSVDMDIKIFWKT